MNFFEQELQKLVGQSSILSDPLYIGRVCYGRLIHCGGNGENIREDM